MNQPSCFISKRNTKIVILLFSWAVLYCTVNTKYKLSIRFRVQVCSLLCNDFSRSETSSSELICLFFQTSGSYLSNILISRAEPCIIFSSFLTLGSNVECNQWAGGGQFVSTERGLENEPIMEDTMFSDCGNGFTVESHNV